MFRIAASCGHALRSTKICGLSFQRRSNGAIFGSTLPLSGRARVRGGKITAFRQAEQRRFGKQDSASAHRGIAPQYSLVAPGSTFAQRLIAKDYRALLVRSFAPGATESDLNLVLWEWGNAAPARLIVIDDEGRLSR